MVISPLKTRQADVKRRKEFTMKENKSTLMSVIANTALTAVATARVNECTALTTNETAIKAVTAFAQLDVFDTKYQIKRCEMMSIMRKAVQTEKTLTFKKVCEVFEVDNSNAGKWADIWDMFYTCDKFDFSQYGVSQLMPFAGKRVDDVIKVFESNEITPNLSTATLRKVASCIDSKHGIIDTGKILDILNGAENGDITTKKTKTKTETETETETETNAETKTETKTETKNSKDNPIKLMIGDYVEYGRKLYIISEELHMDGSLSIVLSPLDNE